MDAANGGAPLPRFSLGRVVVSGVRWWMGHGSAGLAPTSHLCASCGMVWHNTRVCEMGGGAPVRARRGRVGVRPA